MKLNGWLWSAALVLAAACGDAAPEPAAGGAAAPDSAVPAAATEASVPETDVPPAASAPQPVVQPEPTREDSVAAAAEDVSPEWKQRARQMSGYARCMEQASQGESPMRERLQEACRRLPDAP
jgi:hypothetical protein